MWVGLAQLTHVAEPPLGKSHNAAAYPEEVLHHAGQRGLLLALILLFALVFLQVESPFSWRSRHVSRGDSASGAHQN